MAKTDVVIIESVRTAIGEFLGTLREVTAPQLGAVVIADLLARTKIDPNMIDDVTMGCVLSAGQGQAPARQATLIAGLPQKVGATTINKMCGSGLKAIMLTVDALKANSINIGIAGGMENMSRAPHLTDFPRQGVRLGHTRLLDHMLHDGLEDAYDRNKHMGIFAEKCAQHYNFSREQQDAFALQSLNRAQEAIKNGFFKNELVTITLNHRNDSLQFSNDELPQKARPEKIPQLKPVFQENGTVTAANSSGLSDGAAAHLLMRQETADALKLKPLARVIGHASFAQAPDWFTTAPVGAIRALCEKINWTIDSVDLFEINEAFAAVTLAAIEELKLDPKKVNIHGGACALGHPIGASGARILATLIYALKRTSKKRGIAALCIGGGEAVAMAIEVL